MNPLRRTRMNQIKENEQWKTDGDCDKCRREPYCKKMCSATSKKLIKLFKEGYKKYLEQHQKEVEDGSESNDIDETKNDSTEK